MGTRLSVNGILYMLFKDFWLVPLGPRIFETLSHPYVMARELTGFREVVKQEVTH